MLIKIGKMGKNNHNCPKVCYTENDFLNGLSKEKKSSKELCQKIVITSLQRGSTDNISCFVVKLNEGN